MFVHCVVGPKCWLFPFSDTVLCRLHVSHSKRLYSSSQNLLLRRYSAQRAASDTSSRNYLLIPFNLSKMQPSAFRMAVAATRGGLRTNQVALLPPMHLYRRLLRAHRKHLPAEMRLLGDEYIKAEFRAHKNVDNPAHMVRFPPQVDA
jgi:hypothetical protein